MFKHVVKLLDVTLKTLVAQASLVDDNKQAFQESINHLNNSARQDGFSPAKLFYRRRPRCLIPDIITDTKIKEGMKNRNISHQKMR